MASLLDNYLLLCHDFWVKGLLLWVLSGLYRQVLQWSGVDVETMALLMIAHLLLMHLIMMGECVLSKHACLQRSLAWGYLQVNCRRRSRLSPLSRLLTRKFTFKRATVFYPAQLSVRLTGTNFSRLRVLLHLLQNLFLFLNIFRHLYWRKHIHLVLLDNTKIRLTASICRLYSFLLRETCCKWLRKLFLQSLMSVLFLIWFAATLLRSALAVGEEAFWDGKQVILSCCA